MSKTNNHSQQITTGQQKSVPDSKTPLTSYNDQNNIASIQTQASNGLQSDQILWLQRTIGNQATQQLINSARTAAPNTIQRFDDIPTKDDWKTSSKVKRTARSASLESIDDTLEVWETLKDGGDKKAQIDQLYDIKRAIRQWHDKKELKYIKKNGESVRQNFINDLSAIVDQKFTEIQSSFRIDLAPLALEYKQAAAAHDFDLTRTKGEELVTQDGEFFHATTQEGITTAKGRDMVEWATYYFSASEIGFGVGQLTPFALQAIQDFSWLTKALADNIIDKFLIPYGHGAQKNQVLSILKNITFRNALEAVATKQKFETLTANMPILRITDNVQSQIDDGDVPTDNIDALAQAVFEAFLNDLPISGLIYSTVSTNFSLVDYLLGNADAKIGAPCMVLSSIFNELFKTLIPEPPPVIQGGDDRPLLTKKLASIGNKGILTRETDFYGNVKRYGDVRGYAENNRIFFGDGHIWLEINGKEYDPTLGISGPIGTVASQVEDFYVQHGKKYKKDRLKATRTSENPPGGAKLLFDRTVEIK